MLYETRAQISDKAAHYLHIVRIRKSYSYLSGILGLIPPTIHPPDITPQAFYPPGLLPPRTTTP